MTGMQRILAACRREPVDRTPVWFMRQAGRCLAGYRELRERYDILTLTRTPELCTEVTLMPVAAFGVDAAVLYADIMLPLVGMGVGFSIEPELGPVIHEPLRSAADVARLRVGEAEAATPELFTAIRMVRRELDGRTAVIGFAGGPFTVASYLVEGRPSKDHARTRGLLYAEPGTWHALMETLTEVTIRYLRAQLAAGAQVIQLFDSWAGALGPVEYARAVLPYSRRIFAAVAETGAPTIHFGTATAGLLELMASAGSDVVSVDWRVPLDEAWGRIGRQHGIQGNLDPAALLAPDEVVRREAFRVLEAAGDRAGHIFNLGHGVHAETPSERLAMLAELVHAATARDGGPATDRAVAVPATGGTEAAGGIPAAGRDAGPGRPAGSPGPLGVLLLTYGTAVTAEGVTDYLRSVRGGREPPADLVAEFRRRYEVIGRSPLIERTREQAAGVQRVLDAGAGADRYVVEVGMLHSAPWIADGMARLAARQVRAVVGVVLAPQFSPVIMSGYGRAVGAAQDELLPGLRVRIAEPWHLTEGFLDALEGRTREALFRLPAQVRGTVPVLFTAHSLPKAVVERDQAYLDQLRATMTALVGRLGLAPEQPLFAYQSAGHTPEEWLTPDLKDLLPGLRAAGHTDVLVVPLQFLSDHLEVRYDIDVAARAEAEEAGLRFHRIELPNASPALIRGLAEVVRREEARLAAVPA